MALLGSIVGALGSSALSIGTDFAKNYINSVIHHSFYKKNLEASNAMALKFEKDKYSAQVAGMKEAGINPAITSAFSMGWTARN